MGGGADSKKKAATMEISKPKPGCYRSNVVEAVEGELCCWRCWRRCILCGSVCWRLWSVVSVCWRCWRVLEVPEAMCRALLCMLEAVEGELCLLELLEVL